MIAAFKRFFRRRIGFRFRTVLKVLFGGLLGLALAIYLAGFSVIPRAARAQLQKQLGATVTLRSGGFAFPNRIRLNDVVIAEPNKPLSEQPLFRAKRVDVTLNLRRLLVGRIDPGSVSIDDFLLTADYDCTQKRWNLESFLHDIGGGSDQSLSYKLDNGVIKIRRLSQTAPETVTLFSIAGTIAGDPRTKTYNFSLRSNGTYGYAGSKLQGVLKLADNEKAGHVAATGQLLMSRVRIFNNTWNLRDIRLDCAFRPDMLELNTFKFNMGRGDFSAGGKVNLVKRSVTDFRVKLNTLSMSEEFTPDTVVYGQAEKLLGPGLRDFLQRFHPVGSGDVDVTIGGSLNDADGRTFRGEIRAGDVAMKDEKFPYLLEHLHGTMTLTGDAMQVGPLACSHGDVKMVIQGTITDFGPNAHVDLRTTSDNMIIDDDLYQALVDPADKRLWSWLTPTGVTAINNRFQKLPNGEKKKYLELKLKDVGASYKNFRYPLDHLTGTIIIEDNHVQFKDVNTAYTDGRDIVINGQVFDFKSKRPTFRIDINAAKIPVDDRLIRAMPEDKKPLFEKIHLDARGDFKIALFSSDAEPYYEYIVDADLKASRLLYDPFPLDLSDVRLTTNVTRKNIRVRSFRADTDQGRIAMNGTILPRGIDPKQPGFSLEMNLEQFDLSRSFWQATGGAAEQMLSKLRLSGPVNIAGRLVHNAPTDNDGGTDLTVDCKANPVEWDNRRIGWATGHLALKQNETLLKDFHLDGVSLDAIPPDLLGEKTCNLYQAAAPQGRMDMTIPEGSMVMSSDGPQQIDALFRIDCNDVTIGSPQMVHDLNGNIQGYFVMDRPAERWSMDGVVDINRLRYRDFLVEHLSSGLTYDPDRSQLLANEINADFYGGRVEGEFKVDMAPETTGRYTLGFGYKNIDLGRLFHRDGKPESNLENQGTASGLMTLQGTLGVIQDSKGTFTADIENLKMGKQSLIGKILTAVQLKQPQDFVFSKIQINASVKGPVLDCDRVRMVGDPLIFQGIGSFNIKDATMNMRFIAWDEKIGSEDTVLDMIARGLGSALWRVEMKGSVNDPKVDSVYLSVLRQPLDFFKKPPAPTTPMGNDHE